jgi:hypothetical protein
MGTIVRGDTGGRGVFALRSLAIERRTVIGDLILIPKREAVESVELISLYLTSPILSRR